MVNNIFYRSKVFQTPMILFLILFTMIISCSSDRGIITDSSGAEKTGYIRFGECYDRYVEEDNKPFTEFKDSEFSGWKKIDNKTIRSIRRGDEIFIFISLKKVSGESGPDSTIPAKIIVSGNASLYRYCSAKCMSTMMSSKRMDLNV